MPNPSPGPLCASLTPFTEKDELDEAALRRHYRFLAARGVGLCLGPLNTGEGILLRREEIRRMYQIAVEELKGKTSTTAVCLGYTSTALIIELAKEALAIGVDAAQIYAPRPGPGVGYVTEDEVRTYYGDILDAVKGPLYLSFTHSKAAPAAATPAAIGRMAKEHRNIVGINCSTGEPDFLKALIAELPKGMPVRVGGAGALMANLQAGGVGCLAGEANVAPRLVSTICASFKAGDVDRANTLYGKLSKLSAAFRKLSPRSEKALLNRWGIMGPWVRRPYLPLVQKESETLFALADELEIRSFEGV